MILFLICSLPLWFLFLNSFYRNEGIRKRDYFIPFGKGAVLYVISLLLTWLFTIKLSLGEVTPLRLYFYSFLYYNGITNVIWVTLFFLFSFFNASPARGEYRIREILLKLVPLFLGDALYRFIIRESWYGVYELFLHPLMNMALLVFLAVIFVRLEGADGLGKIPFYLLAVFVLLLTVIVPVFIAYNRVMPALIVGVVIFLASLFTFLQEYRGNLPGRP